MAQENKIINIPLYLILSLLTCGLWYLYWLYQQMEILEELDKDSSYSFLFFVVLSLVTCGLYTVYYYYKVSTAIVKIQRERNKFVESNLPVISIILVVFGLGFVTTCIHQSKLNDILRKDSI